MKTKLLIAAAISVLSIGSAQALTTAPTPAAETTISNIEPAGVSINFGFIAPSPYVVHPYGYPYRRYRPMCQDVYGNLFYC